MFNLLGVKLHPVVGLTVGAILIAAGVVIGDVMLCVVGAVMLLATMSGRLGWFTHREGEHRP